MKPLFAALITFAAGCGTTPLDGVDAGSPQLDAGDASTAPNDGGVLPIALSGCGIEYTAKVTLGGSQSFNMMLDTGSTTVGIASSACTNCLDLVPLYAPSNEAVDQQATASAEYASVPVTGWSGEIFAESVLIAGAPNPVVVNLVSIKSQSDFFDSERCGMNSYQGIFGLGKSSVELKNTTGYLDALAATGNPDLLSFELCGRSGQLWLGGVNGAIADQVQYTPMNDEPHFYTVVMTDLKVDSQAVGVTADDLGSAFVDTGGSAFWLPTSAFAKVTAAIGESAAFQQLFGDPSVFFSPTNPNCVSTTKTEDELNAELPALTLVFGSNPAVIVHSLPTDSYLLTTNRAGPSCYGPALFEMTGDRGSLPAIELGATILKGKTTVIDRANKRIGFGPAHCDVSENK